MEAATPQMMQKYNQLLSSSQQLVQKISDLETDKNEHVLVEDTLKPLEGSRRAFRLVGECLVERTVSEVLPSVTSNRQHLEATIQKLQETLQEQYAELSALKQKYNLQEPSGN